MFFGRRQALSRLQDKARKSNSVAIVGLRRIGKSSLLYHFAHHYTNLPDEVVVAYLDLHDSRNKTVSGLLTAALKGLDERLNQRYRFGTVETMGELTEAIEQIRGDGYRPLLCLDEMEELMEHDCFDRDFFEALRYLGSHSKLAFITASRASLADVVRPGGKTSPFFNIFTQLDLAGLEPDDARALLKEPFRRAASRKIPPYQHIRHALKLAGRHPLFLQIAGSVLWEYGGVNREVLRDEFANEAREPLRQLWRGLSANEQAAAIRLAGGKAPVPHWEEMQEHLLRIGLAEQDEQGEIHLFSPLLTEWIKEGKLPNPLPNPTAPSDQRPRGTNGIRRKRAVRLGTKELYAYTLVGLVVPAVVALIVTQLLSAEAPVFIITFVTVLLFILVGVNKMTSGELLEWLKGLMQK